MLIGALNDYYEILIKKDLVLPPAYSAVKIHCMICLTPEGIISNILDYQNHTTITLQNGKQKEQSQPRVVAMPRRTQKTAIESNIVEHRPMYLFGLEYDSKAKSFRAGAAGTKAHKSHQAFVNASKVFFEGMDSPVVQAFLKFVEDWNPVQEVNNLFINGIASQYDKQGYAFCLEGAVDQPLHQDFLVRTKWERQYAQQAQFVKSVPAFQCPISGKVEPTARIHDKIKGLESAGGIGTGGVLIGYKEAAYRSYDLKESYNAQISESVMKRYTSALNHLLQSQRNHTVLDEVMTVYWTADGSEKADDLMTMLMDEYSNISAEDGDRMLDDLMKDAREGKITVERIASLEGIDGNAIFYMVGMKPNASRIAIKFIYRQRYADVLWNIAQHQVDLKVMDVGKPIALWQIKKELISPKASKSKVDPSLMTGVLHSMICGTDYPLALLQRVLLRIRCDVGTQVNYCRAAIIKACVNRIARRNHKEALTVGLNKNDASSAYVCGRLFAVLQKIQEQSVYPKTLNRTIKNGYFSAASVKPAAVFPKLIRLSQSHMKKLEKTAYYEILLQEIMDKLNGEFPGQLSLTEQGRFIVGYYQQYQDFFKELKKDQA